MSHFYGRIDNYRARTKCTRRGLKDSGMTGEITGWAMGIVVEISHKNGKDIAYIYKTDGSNGLSPKVLLMAVTKDGHL